MYGQIYLKTLRKMFVSSKFAGPFKFPSVQHYYKLNFFTGIFQELGLRMSAQFFYGTPNYQMLPLIEEKMLVSSVYADSISNNEM